MLTNFFLSRTFFRAYRIEVENFDKRCVCGRLRQTGIFLIFILLSISCKERCCKSCDNDFCDDGVQNVVLILGQSNGGTLGDIDELIYPYTEKNFCASIKSNTTSGIADISPSSVSGNGNLHGLEISLAFCLQERFKNITIFRHIKGNSSLYQNPTVYDWNVNSTGDIFDSFKLHWNNFVDELNCENINVLAIYWVQGEKDSNNNTWANAYRQNLIDLQNAVFKHINQNANWINVRLNKKIKEDPQNKPSSAVDSVRIAQMEVGDDWIDTDDLLLDNNDMHGVHYSSSGYIEIGLRLCDKTN